MNAQMNPNNTANDSEAYFTRCLGTYYLLTRPNGHTFMTYVSVIVVLSIFSVLSALGNGLIIYVYIKQKSLQRTNTLLLACLAFLDFVSAVVLEPLYVVRLLSEIFGFTSCVYVLIVRRLLEYLRPVSFMTLALITIERYLALFKAIVHRRMATKQRLLHVVLLIWFVWFLVIFIRSFFPQLTSAFYTFFTFVALSLLVGNLIMYFKIGKLARLHSRSTRVSTSPGSLSVGSKYPGSLTVGSMRRGSENSSVMYSKTEESVNCSVNAKGRSLGKVGFQPTETGVTFTKTYEQPAGKFDVLIENNVLSTENETSSNSSTKEGSFYQERNVDFERLREKATQIITSDHLEANEDENDGNLRETVNDRETNLKGENLTEPFSKSSDNISKSNMTICKREDGNIMLEIKVKTDSNNNAGNTDISHKSPGTDCFQYAQQLEGNAEHNTTKGENSAESTTIKASESFVNHGATDESVHQAGSHSKAIVATDKAHIRFKKTKIMDTNSITKTNKESHHTTNGTVLTNAEKLGSRERNATWTVFYIVAILTLCYLPISALLLFLTFKKEPDATMLFIYVPIADTIALFNALVNPLIYCYKNRKMRAAVKNVWQKARNN